MKHENVNNDVPFNGILKLNESEKKFLEALLAGQHSTCSDLVHSFLAKQISIKELYENIIKRAMYDVGELWEYSKISVATEHLASAIVASILNQLYTEIVSKEKINKTVIATCVENEFHQIGIKMICDIFEMNGWNALFLGSSTPISELIGFIKLKKPDLLAISLSLFFNLPSLEKMIQHVQKEFPDLPILVGGQAFQHGGIEILMKYKNVEYKPDLNSTEIFIKNFK